MSERIVNNLDLFNSLNNREDYVYAHLVKFEKPRLSSEVGNTARKASDYAYITDGSTNIYWGDESVDSLGNINTSQTYVANKLVSVGTVQETTEARASNMTINLSGTALGTIITANIVFNSSTSLTADVDLYTNGFQEGDKIYLEGASASFTNNNKYITIKGFSNENKTIEFSSENTIAIDTSREYNLVLASEELTALIRNKNSTSSVAYSSYMNREVYVYRAHINPETGEIIGSTKDPITGEVTGGAFLIFKGIIAKGTIKESPDKSSIVSWGLTSHWGDFVRVQGRLTSDPYHRALTISGNPDIDALLNPAYASDYGFMHAESAINVTGIYQTQETRYKMKKRGGLAGALGGKKLVEYEVTVDREVDLQFNLSAKYLPVVYGVQKVDSIPVFADTLVDDASSLYIAYAICEGEIGGIYDIHIDDNTTVCIDKADADIRTSGDVDVLCNGRADRGDVLAATANYTTDNYITIENTGAGPITFAVPNIDILDSRVREFYTGTNTNSSGGEGLTHETSFSFTTPIDASFTIHTGKEDQESNQELTSIALAKRFKIQNDYFIAEDESRPYWSSSHRLLDTAYAVAKFTLSEGEATIPKYEFVVRGKALDCYNYDGSYAGSGTHTQFSLGDSVSIYTAGGSPLQGPIRIIDKWSFYNLDGAIEYRFRFDEELDLQGNTAFYMQKGSSIWNFYTWDHKDVSGDNLYYNSSTNASLLNANVSISSLNYDSVTGSLTGVLSSPNTLIEAALTNLKGFAQVGFNIGSLSDSRNFGPFVVSDYNSSTNTFTLSGAYLKGATVKGKFDERGSGYLYLRNVLQLGLQAVNTTNAYNGKTLKVTEYIADVPYSKEFKVSKYYGTSKLAAVSNTFSLDYSPSNSFLYEIKSAGDKRVTINPAIQLLDYLTNIRYGKGLNLDRDINLESFKTAAKLCDTQSEVTVIVPSSQTIFSGDVCSYSSGGRLIFEGTVKHAPVTRVVDGITYKEVTFTDVIGKLGYKWTNWRVYQDGDIYWYNGNVYIKSGTGQVTTQPSGTGISSLALTNVTRGGTLSLSITDGYTSSGNPIVKAYTNGSEGFNSPGYSLYDSDDVKYWKYLGWDEPEQRYVTRHQTNQVINTSTPLFDNINSMLLQFNGILRYSNGKYVLAIEQAAPAAFETYEIITQDDIIGDITIDDKGQKDSFNSMSANIVDPANKYAARSISFFNSEYLKEDKGIRRQGNFAMPGISNYYNARLNIKQYLDESRYGITIKFTIDSSGYLLVAGQLISIYYDRFAWGDETGGKVFRISSLNFQESGLVDIVADEHNDDAYILDNIRTSLITGTGDFGGSTNGTAYYAAPPVADSLTATADGFGGILLEWQNSSTYSDNTHFIQIWRRDIDVFSDENGSAELIDLTKGSRYVDSIPSSEAGSYYYWINYFVPTSTRVIFSTYEPQTTDPGVLGSYFVAASVTVKLEATDYSIVYDEAGQSPAYTGNGTSGEIGLIATATGVIDPIYRFTADTAVGDWQDSNISTYTVPSYTQGTSIITVEIAERPQDWQGPNPELDPLESDIITDDTISILRVKEGSDAISVSISNSTHIVSTNNAGENPDLTGSGTSIEVFEGGRLLNSIAIGDTLAAGQFQLAGAPSVILGGITPGASDVTGDLLVIQDHTNMTTSQVVIEYTINGLRFDGVTSFTVKRSQSISQARAGLSGSSTSVVDIYRLGNDEQNPPANPIGVYKYKFDTAQILNSSDQVVTLFEDWSTSASSVSSSNKYLWRISEGVSAAEGAVLDETVTFDATPVIVSVYGQADPVTNRHLITIYNLTNSDTAPALPTQDITYNFTSGSFTSGSLDNGWSLTASAISPTNRYLWETNVVLSSTSSSIIIEGGPTGNWDAPILSAVYGEKGNPGDPTVVADLTNENITVPADNNGGNPVLTGATTTLSIFVGGQNDVDNWQITTSASAGVNITPATVNTKTIVIDGLSVDYGTVTFSASKAGSGLDPVTKVFSISKARAGSNGTPATVYRVLPGSQVIRVSNTGAFTPVTFTANAQSITGNEAPIAYTGGTLKLYRNGEATAVATSTENTSTVSWQITADTTSVRAALEVGGQEVDYETVVVIEDGQNAPDPVIVDLSNENITVSADSDGGNPVLTGATTTLSISVGETNDVDNWQITTTPASGTGGITYTGEDTKTITITGLTVDSASITFSASKTGYSPVTAVFNISKVRAGAVGTPATVYRLLPQYSVIKLNQDATFSPSTYSASAQSITGTQAPVPYTGGTIEIYRNGAATAVATSAANQPDISWVVSEGTQYIEVILKDGDGTEVDSETIFVVENGALTAKDAIVYLYTRNSDIDNPPSKPTSGAITYTFGTGVTANNFSPAWKTLENVTATGSYLWQIEALASSTAASIDLDKDAFSNPKLFAEDGGPGENGLRSAQGYLYYEKSSSPTTPPNPPTGNTYSFATGLLSGSGIGTGVNTWTNEPRTQDPTSSNIHYALRFYVQETQADLDAGLNEASAIYPSNAVRYTNFSGVVTFSDGTFSEGGTPITTIDGGNIDTGTITANQLAITTQHLVNPVSIYENVYDWGGYDNVGYRNELLVPTGATFDWDATEGAARLIANDGVSPILENLAVRSKSFKVNHSSIYRITFKIRHTPVSGVVNTVAALGIAQYGAPVSSAIGTSNYAGSYTMNLYNTFRQPVTPTSNPYIYNSKTNVDTNYDEYTCYIIGAFRNIEDVPNHVLVGESDPSDPTSWSSWRYANPYVKLNSQSNDVSIRILNWGNLVNTPSIVYFKDISVVEIGSGQIVADNIIADAITTAKLQISNIKQQPNGNGTEDGIFMDGANNKIEIWDGGTLRVKLGKL